MRDVPLLHAYVLAVILVHAIGHFAYMGLWRQVTARDFDVNDFKAYYTAALAVRTGRAGELLYSDPSKLNLGLLPEQPWVEFAVASGVPHPSAYIYPPFFAVVLAPITLLPYHEANLLWFGLNVLLLVGSIAFLLAVGRELTGGLEMLPAAVTVFTCLSFFPTIRAMQCGQAGFVLLFLTTGGLLALLRRRHGLAGLCMALAAAIKLTPIVLILWAAWAGRRRAAAWGAGLLVLLTALSVAVAGLPNLQLYLTGFLPTLTRGAATYANQSINGFLNRALTDQSVSVFDFSNEPSTVWILTRAAGVLLLGAAFFVSRPRARPALQDVADENRRTALGYSLVVLTTLLVSPISWEHHYVLALLPLAAMIHVAWCKTSTTTVALLALAYVAMAVDAFELVRKSLPRGSRPALSYVLCGGLLLWVLLARQLAKRRVAV